MPVVFVSTVVSEDVYMNTILNYLTERYGESACYIYEDVTFVFRRDDHVTEKLWVMCDDGDISHAWFRTSTDIMYCEELSPIESEKINNIKTHMLQEMISEIIDAYRGLEMKALKERIMSEKSKPTTVCVDVNSIKRDDCVITFDEYFGATVGENVVMFANNIVINYQDNKISIPGKASLCLTNSGVDIKPLTMA